MIIDLVEEYCVEVCAVTLVLSIAVFLLTGYVGWFL